MHLTNEFLSGLCDRLEQYCIENGFEIIYWLEQQELTTQGGYKVFEKYCEDIEYNPIPVNELNWQEFDDFIFYISKQLINFKKNK